MVSRGLLYHQDKVEGQQIGQLCVPKERRTQVLKLAHDSIFGGHMVNGKLEITTGCKRLCCVMQ